MHFTCAARTDVGIVRTGNEDNYMICRTGSSSSPMDGGPCGRRGGERDGGADHLELIGSLGDPATRSGERIRNAIRSATMPSSSAPCRSTPRGMGTTVTVLALLPERYLIGQVGDSGAYLFRTAVPPLTRTTRTSRSVDAGLLNPDQARVHPYSRNHRCVGAGWMWCRTSTRALEKGDILLLASDGLTGCWRMSSSRYVSSDADPGVVDQMVAEANGGADSTTSPQS